MSTGLGLGLRRLDLHPLDIYNICSLLRRHKERTGPRSLRFHLAPERPLRITLEPWNIELRCPRSVYHGSEAEEIRVWGRRRLLLLERLIPLASRFRVYLLGSGLPSFFLAELGALTFTLGLSGWTANDWSRAGAFDLLAPRGQVDSDTRARVFAALRETWRESADALARRLDLDRATVLAALLAYCQAGRVVYDLRQDVYRLRELSREPLSAEALRFINPREETASRLVEAGQVTLAVVAGDGYRQLNGTVYDAGHRYDAWLTLDSDERLSGGDCSCSFFVRNRLRRGPCQHLLALRIRHGRNPLPG